jgi:tetratricopeptide (TPR) repeat protein
MEGVKKQKYKVAYENALKQGDDSEVQISLGICYLGLKFYDLAAKAFLKAIEVNPFSGVACYYESLSLLRGKRPFLVPIKLVKAAEEKLATGAELGFGKCLAALGVICKDYYELKGMHGDKPSIELFKEARDKGLTDEDLLEVLNELSVPWELPAF